MGKEVVPAGGTGMDQAAYRGLSAQQLGQAVLQLPALRFVGDAGEQALCFPGEQIGSSLQVLNQKGLPDTVAEIEHLTGGTEDRELAADERTVTAEVEEAWFAAIPATLEANLLEAVTIVESRGDQEQRVEIRVVLETMVFDQVLQIFVLVGAEMPGKHGQNVVHRGRALAGHGQPQRLGQCNEVFADIVPMRAAVFGNLGDVDLAVAGV